MFHDRLRIVVRSGRGGDGALSFRREKYVPKGGPDGGDGGRGGDVVLVVAPALRDLSPLRGRPVYTAGRGGNGRGGRRHGADGEPIEIGVPLGTQVRAENGELVADLVVAGARAVVATGGQGGRGNARFATPTRRAPRFAETGLPGETRALDLRLKLVVDAALAGLPNAGKSSLLRRLSNATPKVAEYPFTTVQPVLGTVESPEGGQLTVADVPGLIEGASAGVGLGHEFLAHLERARLLVHVIDGSEGDADMRFHAIDRELELYGAGLDERPQVVVLNKADLSPEPAPFHVEDDRILAVHRVSCVTGEGIEPLKRALFALCPAASEPVGAEAEVPEFLEYRPAPPARRAFRVLRTDRGFRVVGTPPGGEELDDALRAAGVRKGALVEIGDEELEWQP